MTEDKMKNTLMMFLVLLFFVSCDLFNTEKTGTLIIKGVRDFPSNSLSKNIMAGTTSDSSNYHAMYVKNTKFYIKEAWVAQDTVRDSIIDNFEWHSVGESSGLKYFEEFEFLSPDLPAGEYNSLRLLLVNVFQRDAVYPSDTNNVVEVLLDIGGDNDPDSSLIVYYFSPFGSFFTIDGIFYSGSPGESMEGFRIREDKTTTVYWRNNELLGDWQSEYHWTDFVYTWHDANGNGVWDVLIDEWEFTSGPETGFPMWSFLVEEEE